MKTKLPHSLIARFAKEDRLHSLSFWMLMRHRFARRAVFYDNTCRSVSEVMGVSPNTARKHIQYLIKAGLLVKEGGNLRLVGRNRLLKDREKPIYVLIGKNKAEQLLYLRNAIIAYNLIRQARKISQKTSLAKKLQQPHARITESERKQIQKAGGEKKIEGSVNNRVTLSNKTIGSKLNRSVSTGRRYKKQLLEAGLIRRQPHYRTLTWDASVWEYEYGEFHGKGVYYSEAKRRIVRQSSDTLYLSGDNLSYATSSCSKIAHA